MARSGTGRGSSDRARALSAPPLRYPHACQDADGRFDTGAEGCVFADGPVDAWSAALASVDAQSLGELARDALYTDDAGPATSETRA